MFDQSEPINWHQSLNYAILRQRVQEKRSVFTMKVDLNRINALAKKKKEDGLTPAETKEQLKLRKAYLGEIRGQVLGTIDGLKILDKEGNDVTPDKLKHANSQKKHAGNILSNKIPRV